jgi:AraC-like DNA-binding protein
VLAAHLTRSARSARLLLDLAVEKGMTGAAALRGTRLSVGSLDDPAAEIATHQEERLIRNLVAAFPDEPGLGLEAGGRHHVTTFGMLGFATLTSATLRDSLEIALRYQDLGFTLAHARLVTEAETTYVELDTSHLAPSIRRFVIDHQFATFWAAFPDIAGEPPRPRMDLGFPRPVDADRYPAVFGVQPRFGYPHSRLGLPDAYLDRPLPQADPAALAVCERLCLEVLERRAAHVGVTGLVRDRLARATGAIPGMDLVARDLHTTTRSLHRSLRREGTSFRRLDGEVRAERARELLTHTDQSVEAIAAQLGYATPSAFTHAFTRLCGTPPSHFRRQAASAHSGTEADWCPRPDSDLRPSGQPAARPGPSQVGVIHPRPSAATSSRPTAIR